MEELGLNLKARNLCDEIQGKADLLQVTTKTLDCGTKVFNFSQGTQEAGTMLARVCLADLANVTVQDNSPWPIVHVSTEHPVAACMASQYAGWEIKGDGYFAMGSGPMRAAAAREPLFQDIDYSEKAEHCVGVLETGDCPTNEICQDIANKCGVSTENVTLLFAPTNSLAGTLQVVARSVETVLHKLHELKFDLHRVVQGTGTAPLSPVAGKVLPAIGRTNDAILYGGDVILSVRGDDASLEEVGSKLPSSCSPEYGLPFEEILAKYNNDFYQIDPLLFSAAKITLQNTDTGSIFTYGELDPQVLEASFSE